ncbi:putative nucleotidyltransferase, Ribonuclease H [Helianthus anomalus]
MGPFPPSSGNMYILVAIDYVSKWVEAQALPTNDARVVVRFLKKLFTRFGTPRAIIRDRGTHFCNAVMEKALERYGVTHRLSTAYHPQTSSQVENANRGVKRILEKTVGKSRKDWSDKLDDALWAFRTAYKTPLGTTPFMIVYGKACHLPVELEHRTLWALKTVNLDLIEAARRRYFQIHELEALRDAAYERSWSIKEKTKALHDRKLKGLKEFKVGDKVLLYNSRFKLFPGKLKSKWTGPYVVREVFPHGAIELYNKESDETWKVNGHRLKHYLGGPIDDVEKEGNSSRRSSGYHRVGSWVHHHSRGRSRLPSSRAGTFNSKNEDIIAGGNLGINKHDFCCKLLLLSNIFAVICYPGGPHNIGCLVNAGRLGLTIFERVISTRGPHQLIHLIQAGRETTRDRNGLISPTGSIIHIHHHPFNHFAITIRFGSSTFRFEYVPPVLNLHSGDFGAVYSNFGHLSNIPVRVKPIANEMLYDRAGLDERFGAFASYYQLSPFLFALVFYFLFLFSFC